MSRSPEDLLVRFAAGDSAAFDELVLLMGPRLKGFFLRQGLSADQAEDFSQNVFLRLLHSASRYRPTGCMEAFCLRIARNLWIDHCRRGRREYGLEEQQEGVDPAPGPAEEADAGDRRRLLRQALARLDGETRELLELAVLQQLPYKEIGAMLNLPLGTVKSRVYYSLRRMREMLAVLEPGEER